MDFQASTEIVKNVTKLDLSAKARKLKNKTLVFVGDEDNVVYPYKVQLLAKMIKGSQFKEIKGAGHGLFLEQPKRVGKMVRRFLLRNN